MNTKNYFFIYGLLYVILNNTNIHSEEIAKVAIMPFSDQTNSENFQYMIESLPEAIDRTMEKIFEYKKIGMDKTIPIQKEYEKDFVMFDSSRTSNSCKRLDADILIFGHFNFDEATNNIIINTAVFLELSQRMIQIEPLKNPVDNTLFSATEKVATNIIKEINSIYMEEEGIEPTKTTSKLGKIVLRKDFGGQKFRPNKFGISLKFPTNKKTIDYFTDENLPNIASDKKLQFINATNFRLEYSRRFAFGNFSPFLTFEGGGNYKTGNTSNGNSWRAGLSSWLFALGTAYSIQPSLAITLNPGIGIGYSAGSISLETSTENLDSKLIEYLKFNNFALLLSFFLSYEFQFGTSFDIGYVGDFGAFALESTLKETINYTIFGYRNSLVFGLSRYF